MPRLAISGWYHGPALTEPQLQPVFFPPLSTPAPLLPSPQFSLNSQYLNSDTQIQITKKLRKKGAISLADFLDLRFLNSFPFSECAWTNCGPLHLRSYQRCVNPTGKIHAIQSGKSACVFILFFFFFLNPPSASFDSVSRFCDGTFWHRTGS